MEEREARLQQLRSAQEERIVVESMEEREARLQQLRSAQEQRIAVESMEAREARLQQLRSAQEQRIAAESMEEREVRLQGLRSAQEQKISAESMDEKEARLQRVRCAQEQRIVAESAEEREARLLHLRDAWQQTVTSETPEQTEARRERDREYHAQLEAVEPSQLHCPYAHLKMKQFHSKLAALKVNSCVTCLERFPGMSFKAASSGSAEFECFRCARDKHIPKLYSSANNMNPGIVPPELMVRFYTCYILMIHCLFLCIIISVLLQFRV